MQASRIPIGISLSFVKEWQGQNAIHEPVIVRKKEHFAVPFPVILTSGQATEGSAERYR
jgi:hypothetical protein